MKIALLRVGIDSGSGGIQGPLFRDNSFEYIPIPDSSGEDPRRYGNTEGRHGQKLIAYFPPGKQDKRRNCSIHFDPEFKTFTYGDPHRAKWKFCEFKKGDLLVFYAGLQGWGGQASPPALYIIGYFVVSKAVRACNFTDTEIRREFGNNAHVCNHQRYKRDKPNLVIVKGGKDSRLLKKAVKISTMGVNRVGKPIKVLSPEMRWIFGDWNGRVAIERNSTRWIKPEYLSTAANFILRLR